MTQSMSANRAHGKSLDCRCRDLHSRPLAIEDTLQIVVIVLFAIASMLAGFGRAMEMIGARRIEQKTRLIFSD